MNRVVFSTDGVPEAERFCYWRALVSNGLIGARVERAKDQQGPFNGRVIRFTGGSVARTRCRAAGHSGFRGSGDIARRSWPDHFFFYREFGAGAWFGWDRGELATQRGALVIGDPTTPFATKPQTSIDFDLWVLPRKLLDPHLPQSRRPRNLILAGAPGLQVMLKAYLDAFASQVDALDDREIDLVADNFCRLLAVGCGGAFGEHRDAVGLARLEQAKRYVDLHLADPKLSPEKAAAALKMSVRQLHLLFEPSGTSFAHYVLRRRLEECHAALRNPVGGRSVTDVALAWGFNSMRTFHRNFRQAFGAAPGELRGGAAAPR